MRKFLVYLCLFTLVSCFVKMEDTMQSVVNISPEGGNISLKIPATGAWTIKHDAVWFDVSTDSATGPRIITLKVKPNIDAQRKAELSIHSNGKTQKLEVLQLGLNYTEDGSVKEPTYLIYEIPLIFHVLYNDENDKEQNVPYEYITSALNTINKTYSKAGKGSPDFRVKFVLAKTDPNGNLLKEPGVVREHWYQAKTNAVEFMSSKAPELIAMLWDLNRYINIMLYPFETKNLLGISTFPLVPATHHCGTLDESPKPILTMKDLKDVRCISINSTHMARQEAIQKKPVNNDIGHTIAHELGHYFGLRHTFSEGAHPLFSCIDSDNCLDTPSYDRQKYSEELNVILERYGKDPEYRKTFNPNILYKRKSCDGSVFEARNIMDYDFCRNNLLTNDQFNIVRHVLRYSPFIPGPKHIDPTVSRADILKEVNLPFSLSHCPQSVFVNFE